MSLAAGAAPWRAYGALFRMRFTAVLQYRVAALAGVSTQFAWGFMELFAFAAFFKADPEAFPMEFGQTVSYIWLQQAFLALFMMWFWDTEIVNSIMDGAIAYELTRPMDLYARWFCQAVANRLARAALRCVPILSVAFFLPEPYTLRLPPDAGQFGLFLLSAALALGVVAAFSLLVYVSLFYTVSAHGIRWTFAVMTDFLAGAIVPLPFFPPAFRAVLEALPFGAMQNMPLRIYGGHIAGGEAWRGILLQAVWLAALAAWGRWAMGRALRRVTVQGG